MRRLILFLLLLSMAACAPAAEVVPTLTLIPATATLTPTPAPPTATRADLLAPQDILQPTPTPTAADSGEVLTGAALMARDPVAAELVGIAERSVAADLDLPVRRVRLVDVRSAVWTDSTLNCPLPESNPVPLETDGYRIVLQVSEQQYVFHTDFDRVVPCNTAFEQLPPELLPTAEIALEATDEATVELTPELTADAAP